MVGPRARLVQCPALSPAGARPGWHSRRDRAVAFAPAWSARELSTPALLLLFPPCSGDAYVATSSQADAAAVLATTGRELGARVVRVRKARPGEADWAAANFAHPPNGDYAGAIRMRGVPQDADEVSSVAAVGASWLLVVFCAAAPAHEQLQPRDALIPTPRPALFNPCCRLRCVPSSLGLS